MQLMASSCSAFLRLTSIMLSIFAQLQRALFPSMGLPLVSHDFGGHVEQ